MITTIIKACISLAVAGLGIYVLVHFKAGAQALENMYVRQAEKVQAKKGFQSYLFMYNPETWKTPFMRFMFKAMVIFFGIWLIIVAYPLTFGPITL